MATENQKQIAKNVLKNIRKHQKISISKEMRKVGYSKSSYKKPDIVLRSKGWQELMEKYLPDEKLAQVHKYLLNHKDWRAKDAGLDKGYKIKGKYAPVDVNIITKARKLKSIQDRLTQASKKNE